MVQRFLSVSLVLCHDKLSWAWIIYGLVHSLLSNILTRIYKNTCVSAAIRTYYAYILQEDESEEHFHLHWRSLKYKDDLSVSGLLYPNLIYCKDPPLKMPSDERKILLSNSNKAPSSFGGSCITSRLRLSWDQPRYHLSLSIYLHFTLRRAQMERWAQSYLSPGHNLTAKKLQALYQTSLIYILCKPGWKTEERKKGADWLGLVIKPSPLCLIGKGSSQSLSLWV